MSRTSQQRQRLFQQLLLRKEKNLSKPNLQLNISSYEKLKNYKQKSGYFWYTAWKKNLQ